MTTSRLAPRRSSIVRCAQSTRLADSNKELLITSTTSTGTANPRSAATIRKNRLSAPKKFLLKMTTERASPPLPTNPLLKSDARPAVAPALCVSDVQPQVHMLEGTPIEGARRAYPFRMTGVLSLFDGVHR
tara:strand:+ start:38 stop:430 length:393 start_codon:yes stop_codon:yes gene_type:complete